MNAERLLQHYEKIADAPDAMTRLRRFVLDLAVRGKLVPQDANDEPAAVLLKRIANEKARLVPGRSTQVVDAEFIADVPFAIPDLWRWSNIETVSYVEMGQSPPSEHYNQDGAGIAFFQGKADFGERNPTPRYWCTQPTKIAEAEDILISVRAPVGPTNVADQRCCIGRGLAALRPYSGLNRDFLLLGLKSFEADLASLGFGTTFVAITKKQLTKFRFPLPPLAEQHRIVAKVDEMMSLCDQLEAARAGREEVRDRLASSSLARLNAPNPETFQADARFALNALPALTTRPDQIKQLRKTILNLAMRGKLVAQDPKDEPAAELLKRVASEKVDQDMLPKGWCRARVGAFLDFQYGKGVNATERSDIGPVPLFGSNGIVGYTAKPLTTRPSIIVGRKGSAGALNLCEGPSWTTDVAYFVEAPSFIAIRFLLNAFLSMDLDKLRKGVKPGLSRSDVYEQVMCVPPLAEQHRIVAKIDELMALCDQLEVNLTYTTATRRRLLDAILAEALAPEESLESATL